MILWLKQPKLPVDVSGAEVEASGSTDSKGGEVL
jgi:hypothetical protein